MLTPTTGDHPVHFYDNDALLATTVAAFLAPAFAARQAVIAIGTPDHLSAIERRLRMDGHDIDGARAGGQYVPVDAQSALDALMTAGVPTEERFNAVIGPHLQRAVASHGSVRVFGEIVSLLWRDGNRRAALRLEELWDDALGYHPLALICGYDVRAFKSTADAIGVTGIIASHTNVIVPAKVASGSAA